MSWFIWKYWLRVLIFTKVIRAVIYDNDGLLQDTEKHYEEGFRRIAAKFDKILPLWLRVKVQGIDIRQVYIEMIDTLNLPMTSEQYKRELDKILIKLAPTAKMMPGAERLVRYLHSLGLRQAVATSPERGMFERKISGHTLLYNLFNCIVTGDDLDPGKGKPKPDIFLLAAKNLGVKPGRSLVFGDTPADVKAALAAGMYVIGVSASETMRKKFHKAGAHLVLSSLEDFYKLPAENQGE